MTVLHLISSEGYYGAESMLVTLARALTSLDCRCIVGVFRDSRLPHLEVAERAEQQRLKVEIVNCAGRWDWKTVRQIRGLLDRYCPDVLHTHGYKADLYGYLAAWPRRAALVSTCHNWPSPEWRMRAYAALDRMVLRNFDRVAAVSDSVSATLRTSGVPDARLISNGVEVERLGSFPPVLRDEIIRSRFDRIVGFVGRLVPEKGGDVLIQAAKQVIAAQPSTAFVFVGEGPYRDAWQNLARQLGLTANVMFVGKRCDMPQVYASLDVLVLPSWVEAMPMCVLEAMAAGVPVIATRVGSVPQLITPGVTGMLIAPGDADALAGVLVGLLANPKLARSIAAQGRARIVQRFSAGAMARAYVRLYDEALAGRRPTHEVLTVQ